MLSLVVANRGYRFGSRDCLRMGSQNTKERMPSHAFLLAFCMLATLARGYSNGQRKAYERALSVETVISYIQYPSVAFPSIEKSVKYEIYPYTWQHCVTCKPSAVETTQRVFASRSKVLGGTSCGMGGPHAAAMDGLGDQILQGTRYSMTRLALDCVSKEFNLQFAFSTRDGVTLKRSVWGVACRP